MRRPYAYAANECAQYKRVGFESIALTLLILNLRSIKYAKLHAYLSRIVVCST